MKEAKQYLKDFNITEDTKYHNYDYLYNSLIKIIKQVQIDVSKSIDTSYRNIETQSKIMDDHEFSIMRRSEDKNINNDHYDSIIRHFND